MGDKKRVGVLGGSVGWGGDKEMESHIELREGMSHGGREAGEDKRKSRRKKVRREWR